MFDVSAIKGERALRALSMWNHFYHGSFLMRYHDDLVACDEYLWQDILLLDSESGVIGKVQACLHVISASGKRIEVLLKNTLISLFNADMTDNDATILFVLVSYDFAKLIFVINLISGCCRSFPLGEKDRNETNVFVRKQFFFHRLFYPN